MVEMSLVIVLYVGSPSKGQGTDESAEVRRRTAIQPVDVEQQNGVCAGLVRENLLGCTLH